MAARMLLKKKGVAFEEISVTGDIAMRREMEALSGRHTVPQIFIDGQAIGGFYELNMLDEEGKLDSLLGAQGS
jgi:glutaredoxin 3